MLWDISPDDFGRALSILASILSISSSVKKISETNKISPKEAIDVYESSADDEEKKFVSVDENRYQIIQLVDIIPSSMLEQLYKELNECIKRFTDDRIAAGDEELKKRQSEINVSRCSCSVLNTIKLFNDGELPELVAHYWRVFKCT